MSWFHRDILIYSVGAFFLFSWPFAYFPITDGDVNNWSDAAYALSQHWDFFSGDNDQSHGPLLVWTAAIAISVLGPVLYALNFFNVLFSVLGLVLIYYFSYEFWKNRVVASLACFFYVSCLGAVYLSRTPMYDWPASLCFFGFCGFYALYAQRQRWGYLGAAYGFIALGSLSRFSICMGLAGFFILCVMLIYKRSFFRVVLEGLGLICVIVLANAPWFLGQFSSGGMRFLTEFIYDNTGRYIKSTRPGATIRFDFYGLPLYTLIGLLPYTFLFVCSFFRRSAIDFIKKNKPCLVLVAGFLPALILFSFSGHTKLARYIAYVFPYLFMLMAYRFVKVDVSDPAFKSRCQTVMKWVTVLLTLLLCQQTIQFWDVVQESKLFVFSVLFLIYGLLWIGYAVVKKGEVLVKRPLALLPYSVGIYLVFFSLLAYESVTTPFLKHVTDSILRSMGY